MNEEQLQIDALCEDIMRDVAFAGYRPCTGYELVCQWVSSQPLLETQEYRRTLVAWLQAQPVGTTWDADKNLPVHGNPNGMHLRFLEPTTRTNKAYGVTRIATREID